MRCGWCSTEATRYTIPSAWLPPACTDHIEESAAVAQDLAAWCGRMAADSNVSVAHFDNTRALLAATCDRDARELRGEPPSMEGWVLW